MKNQPAGRGVVGSTPTHSPSETPSPVFKGNMNQENIIPKQVQWYDDRFYEFEFEEGRKEYFASTTTKLGIVNIPFLSRWRGDIGNTEADKRLKDGQDKGSREHDAWEALVKGGVVIFNPRKKPVYKQEDVDQLRLEYPKVSIIEDQEEMHDVTKLAMFLDRVKPVSLASEIIVYDVENRDAGTMDNLFKIETGDYMVSGSKPIHIEGGIYVADLKSGKVVGKSAYKQVACYAKCVEKMGMGVVKGTMILHTSATTRSGIEGFNCIVRTREEMERDYKSYRLTAALWEDENQDYSPKVFSLPTMLTYKEPVNERV